MLKRSIISIILLGIINTSCIEPPDQFIAPTYNVDLNFPVTDTLLTIHDFLRDDSNFVASTDPEQLGLLHYTKTNTISPFYIDDNLKINKIDASSSLTIGEIKIKDTPNIGAKISLSDLTPITEGSETIFPPMSAPINSEFEEINDFISADFESGFMEIRVNNNLPVPIELREIKIKNSVDDVIIAEFPPTPATIIPSFDSTIVSLPLSNKQISANLKVEGILITQGSGGELVTIPIGAGISFSLRFTDFILNKVTAILPAQDEIQIDSSVVINDSTKIESAIFDEGKIDFRIENYIDLDINVHLQIENLMKPDGSAYTENFIVQRNNSNQVFQIESLKDWRIETTNSGELINELKYTVKISSEATNDERTISQNDSVNVSFNLDEVVFSYAKGLIKPTTFEVAPSEIEIDLGDIENKYSFDSLSIKNPSLKLAINSSINFDVLLNATIIGISENITKELPIVLELPSLVSTEFDLRDQGISEFINSFTTAGAIPTKFIFSGNGIVNPNYIVGSVSKTDSIIGATNFELPFDFGISGGNYTDTIHINKMSLSEDEINSINSVLLTIDTDNKIPVNLIVNGCIIDIDGNQLIKIPPEYNFSEYLVIESPQVDTNGDVVSSQLYTQHIELRTAEAQEFIRNPNIVLSILFGTPPPNSVANVKFKTTDSVYFKIYGKINYRVNN